MGDRIKMQKILAGWNSNSDVTDENPWGNELACKSPEQIAEKQDGGDITTAEKSLVNQKKLTILGHSNIEVRSLGSEGDSPLLCVV